MYASVVLIISLHVHRLGINLLIEFGSKMNERNTTKNKFIQYRCFIVVDFIHRCHHRLKMSTFSLKKNKFRSIAPADLLAINVTTAFTIPKCLECEFLIRFWLQGRQQSIWLIPHLFKYPWLGVMSFEQMKTSFRNCPSCLLDCRDGQRFRA